MAYKHATNRDKKVGKAGEKAFVQYCKDKGLSCFEYTDKEQQAKCGDFWVVTGEGKYTNFEVKTREKNRTDILIELWSNRVKNIRGWISYLNGNTQVFYQFLESGQKFLFKVKDMRKYLNKNIGKFQLHSPSQKGDSGTEFICIPIMTLMKAGILRNVT